MDELLDKLNVQQKIASGAESLLDSLDQPGSHSNNKALRGQVEKELTSALENIRDIRIVLDSLNTEDAGM